MEVPEVVKAAEDWTDHFLREEAMTEVRPAETTGTSRAVTRLFDGQEIIPKPGMPESEWPCGGED